MDTPLLAKVRQGWNLIQQLRDGDPFAVGLVILTPLITGLVVWLMVVYYKRQMRKWADALEFDSTFSPNGLFGREIFVVCGQINDVDIAVTAKKIKKGDYRTYLEIAKPSKLPWDEIRSGLSETTRKVIASMRQIDNSADFLTFEIRWVGGEIDGIVLAIKELAKTIRQRCTEKNLVMPQLL